MLEVKFYEQFSKIHISENSLSRKIDKKQWHYFHGPKPESEAKYFAEYFAEWFDAYEAAESDSITLAKEGTKYELSVKNPLGEEMLNVSFTRKEITKDEFDEHAKLQGWY